MRVLFLTHRLPYTADRGDRIRALNLLTFLQRHAEVDLVSLVHDRGEEEHAPDLHDVAASVSVARTQPWLGYAAALAALPTRQSFTHALLDAPGLRGAIQAAVDAHPPDVVLAYCSGMARLALEPPLDAFPFVLDMVDVDSEKWKALGTTAQAPSRWIYASEARRLASFERVAVQRAEAVLVVNERERESVLQLEPGANVHVIPNGVAVDHFRPLQPPSSDPRVVFCGVMNYPPNEEAALWLGREVWPLVVRQMPAARLSLVGSSPPASLYRLAESDPTIEVTGTVPDVRPHLWRAAIAAAPLRIARGVQNKVLEAVAAGLPCVITPAVLGGLPPEVLPACEVADDAEAFAASIGRWLSRAPEERRAAAERADLQPLTWPERLAPLLPVMEAASQSAKRDTPSTKSVDGS
jgi:sugar transferase (PEP-CTERM/EpsH1 system associated)